MKFDRYYSPEDVELFELFTIETSNGEDLFFTEPYNSGGSVVMNRDTGAYLSSKEGGKKIFNVQSMQIRVDDLRAFYESAEKPILSGERDLNGDIVLDKKTGKPKTIEIEQSAFDWGF